MCEAGPLTGPRRKDVTLLPCHPLLSSPLLKVAIMITQCCSLLLLLCVPSLGVPWHLQLSFGLPYQPPHQSNCKVVLTVNIEQLSALLLTESLLPLQMENLLKSYGQLAINLFLNCGKKMQMLKSLTMQQCSVALVHLMKMGHKYQWIHFSSFTTTGVVQSLSLLQYFQFPISNPNMRAHCIIYGCFINSVHLRNYPKWAENVNIYQ